MPTAVLDELYGQAQAVITHARIGAKLYYNNLLDEAFSNGQVDEVLALGTFRFAYVDDVLATTDIPELTPEVAGARWAPVEGRAEVSVAPEVVSVIPRVELALEITSGVAVLVLDIGGPLQLDPTEGRSEVSARYTGTFMLGLDPVIGTSQAVVIVLPDLSDNPPITMAFTGRATAILLPPVTDG